MTATDLIDGLTGSEVRQFALAVARAVERHDWHRDTRRLLSDLRDAVDLAERLAIEPADYQPIPVEAPAVKVIVRSPGPPVEVVEAIRREYVPNKRGGYKPQGPALRALARKYGVSYQAARNAVREAA